MDDHDIDTDNVKILKRYISHLFKILLIKR